MLNETASDEASFCSSQKSSVCVCSSQKNSSCGGSATSETIDVVNFTPDPLDICLVDYGSSEELEAKPDCPKSDADGAVFDLCLDLGELDEMKDGMRLAEKKEF